MLNLAMLEDSTIDILKKSGWIEGRKKNISEWIEILTEEGYIIFKYAQEILEELGGLDIRPERVKIGKSLPGDVDFFALDAGSGEVDRLEDYEPLANETIFPLGMVFSQWFLYVGESKKVYMGSYEEFYLIGNNIEDALNNIFTGNSPPKPIHKS